MTSLKQAFSLSKGEVKNARPPGTATLVGEISPTPLKVSLTDESNIRTSRMDSVANKPR